MNNIQLQGRQRIMLTMLEFFAPTRFARGEPIASTCTTKHLNRFHGQDAQLF